MSEQPTTSVEIFESHLKGLMDLFIAVKKDKAELQKEIALLRELVGEVEEIVTCSSTVFQNMWDKGESLSMIMQEVLYINEIIFTKIKERREK